MGLVEIFAGAVAVGALGAGAGWLLERRMQELPRAGRVAIGAVITLSIGAVAVAWWIEDLQRIGLL